MIEKKWVSREEAEKHWPTLDINEKMKKINEYIKIKQASKYLGVTQNTLRNWEKQKRIKTYRNKINNYRLYKIEDLDFILKNITEQQ